MRNLVRKNLIAKLDYDDYITKTRELSKWIKEAYPNEKIISL